MNPAIPNPDGESTPVAELKEQRDRVREWLAKLGEVGSDAPPHVTERIRGDYEERLATLTEQLAAHGESLREELQEIRGSLADAEGRRRAAQDALDEARLRHLIGEIEEADWGTRRLDLESGAAAAEDEVERLRGDAERLEELLAEMEPAAAGESDASGTTGWPDAWGISDDTVPEYSPPRPASEPSIAADPDASIETDRSAPITEPAAGGGPAGAAAENEDGVDLSWLEEIEPGLGAAKEELDAGTTGANDLAFLEELDRAIAASSEAPTVPPPPGDDATVDPERAGMLLCKECGAINDPQAWYCEVCGSEL